MERMGDSSGSISIMSIRPNKTMDNRKINMKCISGVSNIKMRVNFT